MQGAADQYHCDYALCSLNEEEFNGDQVQTQLTNVTLAHAAAIVSRLETSPLVAGPVVSTAATMGSDGTDGDLVQASITIQLQTDEAEEVDEAAEE